MKNRTFTVMLTLTDVTVDVTISAESLEDAIAKGKELNMRKDILREDIGWNDGHLKVTGVFE